MNVNKVFLLSLSLSQHKSSMKFSALELEHATIIESKSFRGVEKEKRVQVYLKSDDLCRYSHKIYP